MNENLPKETNLLDTTDCLEAVGVFKAWKNGMFWTIFCCLILLQGLFWVVNLGLAEPPEKTQPAAKTEPAPEKTTNVILEIPQEPNAVASAAAPAVTDPNQAAPTETRKTLPLPAINFRHVAMLIRLLDLILILAAILYCLTILFCLKISLLGRLGGISHISTAFFLSLCMFAFIFPWQRFFFLAGLLGGAVYTPAELAARIQQYASSDYRILAALAFYLRFLGYWLIAMLFLIFSGLRTRRWTKATLRRLEIIE